MDDCELERLATEELLKEAKRGKVRAEQAGALGWQKCPLPKVNRRFMGTMLLGTVSQRRREEERQKSEIRYEHEETAASTDRRKRDQRMRSAHAQHRPDLMPAKRSRKSTEEALKKRQSDVAGKKASKHKNPRH